MEQDSREGGEALTILQSCGLSPRHYDTIEKAARGVKEIIDSLRGMLSDPPHDVQCRVLQKLEVEGFARGKPKRKIVNLPEEV